MNFSPLFTFFNSESVRSAKSMSRFLKLFTSKSKPGSKGKTIKKPALALVAKIDTVDQDASKCQLNSEDITFPREYYTPRPIPKSFVVSEVRKLTNNGSQSDSLICHTQAFRPEQATAVKVVGDADMTASLSSCSHSSPSRTLKSTLPTETTEPTIQKTSLPNGEQLPSGLQSEQRPCRTFDFLLGQQSPDSLYFTRRYFNEPDVTLSNTASRSTKDTLHHLSELDPQAFELYKIYLLSNRIAFQYPEDISPGYAWVACWPLMNAQILGCIIGEPDFADRAMDTLVETLTAGICPDSDTIEHLFNHGKEGMPEMLKLFAINRFIEAQQQSQDVLNTINCPISFKLVVLQAALQRLSRGSNMTARSGCVYHTHGMKEACYKTRLTPVDTPKERHLVQAREAFAKDAAVVVANVVHHGIESVDWEQCHAEVSQALRLETGRTWMGSRILEGDQHAKDLHTAGSAVRTTISMNDRSSSQPTNNQKRPLPDRTNRGAKQTNNLIKTPNNSLVSRREHQQEPYAANDDLATQTTSANVPAPAELQGSTVYDTRYTDVDRAPSSNGDRAHVSITVNSTNDNVLALSRYNEEGMKGYADDPRCPSAYPESNVGA